MQSIFLSIEKTVDFFGLYWIFYHFLYYLSEKGLILPFFEIFDVKFYSSDKKEAFANGTYSLTPKT